MVYDTVLHVADEVEYIWSGQGIWVKYAYAFVRHLPYLVQGSILAMIAASDAGHAWKPAQCQDWIIYQLSFNECLTVVVEAILIVRIYALFNHNVPILTLIAVLYVGEITAMVTVLALSIPKMTFTSQCVITSTPVVFTSYWIISLSFETLLFALTIIKFCTSISHSALGRGSILFVLVRDGTWAYAIIFVIMLTNTLLYHLVDNPLAGLCFFWQLSVMSFAGSHVLLNLRRLAVRHTTHYRRSIWTAGSAHTMQFTPRSTFMSDRMSDNDIELHVIQPRMDNGLSDSDDTT